MTTLKAWGVFLGLVGFCAACSSSNDSGKKNDNWWAAGGTSGGGGAGTGASAGSGTGSVTFQTGGTTGGIGDAAACPGQVYQPEILPVDAYIMFDQSTSMDFPVTTTSPTTWFQAAAQAVTNFANNSSGDAKIAALGVGIQFFALPNGSTDPAYTCLIPQYATPEVEISPLSTNAQNIINAVNAHLPTGLHTFTPTEPALQGALDHMTAWAPTHAGRAAAVVLVTDGLPSQCDLEGNLSQAGQIVNIANRAAAAYNGPYKIRTFVVGFENGAGLSNLNEIAAAGGTKQAFLISPGTGDIGSQFVNAMKSISNTTLQCDFPIPASADGGTTFDGRVSIIYTPAATGVPQLVPYLGDGSGLSTCQLKGNNGWYYDAGDYRTATRLIVCPGTCSALSAGTVSIRTGCSSNDPIH